MTHHPELPPEVRVLDGTDVEDAWRRFAPFEALHDGIDIAVPMTSEELDTVIERLAPRDGERMLDLACGPGELLLRARARAAIDGVGLDLSPWMLRRALARARTRATDLRWWLGDGARLGDEPAWDVIACLGAPWIFHGFAGTARALARRLRPGGRVAIGDLRARSSEHADAAVEAGHGRPVTRAEQLDALRRAGLVPVDEVTCSDEGWLAYADGVVEAAERYAASHPELPWADQRAIARQGRADASRDRRWLEWTVWVARLP